MTVATPQSAVGLLHAWLASTLGADTQLAALVGTRIYAGTAPEGAPYPLVTFQDVSARDLTTPGFRRVFTTFTVDVHCADRVGSIVGLDAIVARVDAALHGQAGFHFDSGAYAVACTRTGLVSLAGQEAGVATRELIATYSVIIQEAGDV